MGLPSPGVTRGSERAWQLALSLAGLGGYHKYMPNGVAVANFGISIIADCRDYVVEYFQPRE